MANKNTPGVLAAGERKLGVATVIEYPEGSGSFVLVEEIKAHKKGRLNLPGGEVDEQDERVRKKELELGPMAILKAAVREAKEESGLKIELTRWLSLFDYQEDGKLQIALAGVAIGGELRASRKHPTVESYPFEVIRDELAPQGRLRSDRVLQAIMLYREGPVVPIETGLNMTATDALPQPVEQSQESRAEPVPSA